MTPIASTTAAAARQSSPTTKSHQKWPKALDAPHASASLPLRRSIDDGCEREQDHEREHARERGVVAGPVRARAFRRPEDPERRQHHADRELQRVLRHARERCAHEHADDDDEHERRARAERGEADVALRAAERDDDERDLEAFEQHALEREREAVPVDPGAQLAAARRGPPRARARRSSSSSCSALKPLARRIALRSHCRPNVSSKPPTTSRSALIGMRVSAGPSAATITASASVAAPSPVSAERQPRETPAASTIVSASTNSTALARNADAIEKPAVTRASSESGVELVDRRRAKCSCTILRRSFSVGVTSPSSCVKSRGRMAKRLICSTRTRSRFTSSTISCTSSCGSRPLAADLRPGRA